MANAEHAKNLITFTAEQWNKWRDEQHYERLEISGLDLGCSRKRKIERNGRTLADFRGFDFSGVDLISCSMSDCDLSEAMLDYVVWREVRMTHSVLRGAQAFGASFVDCQMYGLDARPSEDGRPTILSWSRFPESMLHDADFSGARLARTDFAGAELTGARFNNCDLSSVMLIGASLACTELTSADCLAKTSPDAVIRDIVETEFSGSYKAFYRWELEQARFENPSETLSALEINQRRRNNVMRNLSNRNSKAFANIEELRMKVRSAYREAANAIGRGKVRVYYRGHGCTCWELKSSLERKKLEPYESEMLDELAVGNPGEFRECRTELDRIVLARHHMLPTRLLDVTLDPLVSLYFACIKSKRCRKKQCDGTARLHCFMAPQEIVKGHDSDTVSVLAAFTRLTHDEQRVLLTERLDEGCDTPFFTGYAHYGHHRPAYRDTMLRLCHFVAREKPYFEDRIDPKDFFKVVVVEPERSFPRIRSQSGAFLLSAYHTDFDALKIAETDKSMPIYGHLKFDIPPSARENIMDELDFLHIDEERLFPGLEGSASSIVARHVGSPKEKTAHRSNEGGEADRTGLVGGFGSTGFPPSSQ